MKKKLIVLLFALGLIVCFGYNNNVTAEVNFVKENCNYYKCYKCNGSGKCKTCHGTGKLRCGSCNGSGKEKVSKDYNGNWRYDAFGSNTRTCSTCDGKCKVDCEKCNGSGDCDNCNGTGNVR